MAKLVVIHCSDSPNDRKVHASDIHQWHRERGFDGIGYHWVITRSGQPEAGRPEYWNGAHVKGYNTDSIGICLVGRDRFTWRQFKTLFDELIPRLEQEHGKLELVGHYELDGSKTCPNFYPKEVYEYWQQYREVPVHMEYKDEEVPS